MVRCVASYGSTSGARRRAHVSKSGGEWRVGTRRGNLRWTRRVGGAAAAVEECAVTQENQKQERPSSAETARTLVQRQSHATLGTISSDGWPLTTYAGYVLDESGQPIIRLRQSAVHTANVRRDNRVSLLVTTTNPAVGLLGLARCTVLGKLVDDLDEKERTELVRRYKEVHKAAHGVDKPSEDDIYMRLDIEKVFYVGGLRTDSRADFISKEEYKEAKPDPLCAIYDSLIHDINSSNMDELLIVSDEHLKRLGNVGDAEVVATSCRLAHIDRLGIDVHTTSALDAGILDVRIGFKAPVSTESEARSAITMMAQTVWEKDKKYIPPSIQWEDDDDQADDVGELSGEER